jgi:hypothetical protein
LAFIIALLLGSLSSTLNAFEIKKNQTWPGGTIFNFGHYLVFANLSLKTKAATGQWAEGEYVLKNGQIYQGLNKLDVKVAEIATETGGPFRYYLVLPVDDGARLYFFGSNEQFLASIPLLSEEEFQGLYFNSDGSRFLLASGAPGRTDVIFKLYETDKMELKMEVAGFKDNVQWLDKSRIVLTRFDGYRGDENAPVPDLRPKLSAVILEAAPLRTVILKEATATQNYLFDSVTPDGVEINLTEKAVSNAVDWVFEDKVSSKDIRVKIPLK